jgi:hypothetical protein
MPEDERKKDGDESGRESHPGDPHDDEDARVRHPDGPTELSQSSWWEAVRRTPSAVFRDNVLNFAGALTYFAVLALLPAVVGFVSLLVLVPPLLLAPKARAAAHLLHCALAPRRHELHAHPQRPAG